MDDHRQPAEEAGHSLQGPHWRCSDAVALPHDFVPLRLLLESGSLSLQVTRPDMVLGRHSQADLRLPLPDISRRHCRFLFAEGRWQVVDLKSLNGVFVNGQRVERLALTHRDLLRIGSFTFVVDLLPETQSLPSISSRPNQPTHILQSIADALPSPEGSKNPRRAS